MFLRFVINGPATSVTRCIAALVLFSFTSLTLEPLQAAIQDTNARQGAYIAHSSLATQTQNLPRDPATAHAVHLAQLSAAAGIPAPDAADLADLAETPGIQLTPEIRQQAAALNNNPVAIHDWVSNTIAYTPGIGSIQGAAGTYRTRHGNDVDTASKRPLRERRSNSNLLAVVY